METKPPLAKSIGVCHRSCGDPSIFDTEMGERTGLSFTQRAMVLYG
jgi:hypothetical protein